jgi:hypothetical protein
MNARTRWVLIGLGAVVLPVATTSSVVFFAWLANRDSLDFGREAWNLLVWAPIVGTALGGAVLLFALRGLARLATIAYLVLAYWFLVWLAVYLEMMLTGNTL